MIVIVEPACTGSEHAPFNAAMVKIASLLASGSDIIFYGENSHIEAIKLVLADSVPSNISWQAVHPPPRHLRSFVKRFIIESILFRRILHLSRSCDLLIVTSALETSLPALKTQCYISRFRSRINVIFHAGLPQFLYSRKRQKLLSMATPANMKYIVLGEYIKNGVMKKIPELSNRIFGIEHPYLFDTTKTNSDQPNSKPIFGFIGLANKAKGFDIFLEIIESLSQKSSKEDSKQFKLAGKVSDDCRQIFNSFLKTESSRALDYPVNREKLPLDVYRNEVNSVDYFVMPYDKNSYEFICSGAAMDALYFTKPIIALKSPYFSYLFDLCGDIGYLCNDLNHMKSVIAQLINTNDLVRYEKQRKNLLLARTHFSPTTVSKAIANINGHIN